MSADRREFLQESSRLMLTANIPSRIILGDGAFYIGPFQGYSKYVEKLKENIGEDVVIQERFGMMGGPAMVLDDVPYVEPKNKELFPHSVSFYDGTTINLKNIASIVKYGASQWKIDPNDEDTLYVDIPRQMSHEASMRKYLEYLDHQERRFGSP